MTYATILAALFLSPADETERLSQTQLLTWQGDLDVRMMDGLHRFIERKIDESVAKRAQYWHRDFSARAAYEKSIQPNRERFKKIIGVVNERLPVHLERYGELVASDPGYEIYPVRWPVLDGFSGDGIVLEPRGRPRAIIIAVGEPGKIIDPNTVVHVAHDGEWRFARQLAKKGFKVIIPGLVGISSSFSGKKHVGSTNEPGREWIYRQAYHMGRHIIGFEVEKILSLVDWSKRKYSDLKIAIAGYGEGGLLALYAAAADPRIDACLASGYFQNRQHGWEEPLYRNVWSLLREFGDAELATLIAPRGLVIDYYQTDSIEFPRPLSNRALRAGVRAAAARGTLRTAPYASVAAEFQRIHALVPARLFRPVLVKEGDGTTAGTCSRAALGKLVHFLETDSDLPSSKDLPTIIEPEPGSGGLPEAARCQELEAHVQHLVRDSERVRAEFFPLTVKPGPNALAEFQALLPKYRKYLWEEVLGKFDDPCLPLNPRSRKIYDRPKWTGYDVVLDVFPDVFAWGVLLLPRDIKPGERRPVVVCQHGRNGVPKDTIEGNNRSYHDFAAKLADRGFIVFAPHNPYRGEDRYRFLSRKANNVKASLFSFILAQHEQILNWLETLPQVDPKRIAFYGLSYGGETAVRVPPLLERYCLSICSADFNDWARKVASTDSKYSFMFTNEWEMPYFNMGNTFNYAELAALMVPRPFMVERGHDDGVAPNEWVAYEYAKVRRLYDQLGIGDRTEIEFFNGPHTIHGVGTFRFLHKHLRWPEQEGGKEK
jgi:dienelactone hydrolase